jgi:hypothetical protein
VALGDEDEFNVYVFYYPFRVFSVFWDSEGWSSKYNQIVKIYPDLTWDNFYFLDTLDFGKTYFLCLSLDEQINTIVKFLESSKQHYFR